MSDNRRQNRWPEDLLSAYADGELSPDEHAEAEEMLRRSAEARRELQEIRQISQLLQSHPKRRAPEELPVAVRQQAERETLLATTPEDHLAGRKSRRWWLAALGGLTAMVLLAVVSARFLTHSGPFGESNAAQELAKTEGSAGAGPNADRRPKVREAQPSSANRSRETESVAKTAPAKTPGSESFGGRDTKESSREKVENPPALDAERSLSAQRFQKENLGQLEVGDVLRYARRSGQAATLVEMTVVDVQKALGTMQVLLAKNDVLPSDADGQKADVASESQPGRANASSENGLFALYVESSPQQLAAALSEMNKQELVVDWEPQPSIPVEAVQTAALKNSAGGKKVTRNLARRETSSDKSRANGFKQRARNESQKESLSEAKEAAAKKKPATALAMSEERDSQVAVARKPKPPQQDNASPRPSLQVSFRTSVSFLRSQAGQPPQQRADSKAKQRLREPQAASDRQPSDSAKPGDQALARIRILFVFHQHQAHPSRSPGAQEQ